MLPVRSILCPVDFSDTSSRALRLALAIAANDNARLTVLTVNDLLLVEAAAAAYDVDYLARVPRWLPDFGLWHDIDRLEAQPRLIVLTFRDALIFLAAFPVLELFEELQAAGYLPVWLYLP